MPSPIAEALKKAGIKRQRSRNASLKVDQQALGDRVVDFYTKDTMDRNDFVQRRLQLYAKYRMWTEREDLPWQSASDIPLPDMMSDSLRVQDTLFNAVLAIMPPIKSKALRSEERDKQENVDNLITHQFFNDQDGETTIGDLAESFVNDGYYVCFIPWIIDEAKIFDLRQFPPIPEDALPSQYFSSLLNDEFPNKPVDKLSDWHYRVSDQDQSVEVNFYTATGKVEMTLEKTDIVFNGPKPLVKDIDDVLFPWTAGNLQIPGSSNPDGSSHVILIDYPTLDEIRRLQKSDYYDLINSEDVDAMEVSGRQKTDQLFKQQKDSFQGTRQLNTDSKITSHRTVTRLICFDRLDIDDDGLDEDVMVWVCKETRKVMRLRRLSEMFPASPPRRPLVSQSMIPVKGRVIGISLLEMMEGLHDAMKETLDGMSDSGQLESSPFFFYKPTSSINPEEFILGPGDGIPVSDPKNDVFFPTLGNQGQSFGFNMLTILGQMSDKLTMVSDIQRGQIPTGKSSALRTAGGIKQLISQGESRPERILRRFFHGLSEIYHQFHEMNQRMLPEKKKILITGNLSPDKDPYQTIADKGKIQGRFQFNFSANILNTSKAAIQEALNNVLSVAVSEVAFQTGIIKADGLYRLMRDMVTAWGQEPDDYLTKPQPDSDLQRITAEQAMISIINNTLPGGTALEGWSQHLQILTEMMQRAEFALLDPSQVQLFTRYVQEVGQRAEQERVQIAQAQAAQNFQVSQQQTSEGGAPASGNQRLSPNEKLNENLK